MKIVKLDVDSLVFGRPTYSADSIVNNLEDLLKFKSQLSAITSGAVSCKVPAENVNLINELESDGFRFQETQLQSKVKLRDYSDQVHGAYEIRIVSNENELREVQELAKSAFSKDRFSVNSDIGEVLSGQRYSQFVEKSFTSKDEEVFGLYEIGNTKPLAFRTHRITSDEDILFLLGGVSPLFQGMGLGAIAWLKMSTLLCSRGFKRAITHISAANLDVLNLEISQFHFKVTKSLIVLSKDLSS